MELENHTVSLGEFVERTHTPCELQPGEATLQKLVSAHETVTRLAAGDEPVYGLNTGLGGNLGYRLDKDEISEFQMQIIAGRAAACGDLLPEQVGRGILFSRIVTAAKGYSGMSPELFGFLCNAYSKGISPAVPEYGSIGDSDLLQNAQFALGLLGQGEIWLDEKLVSSKEALERSGLEPPALKPKEGLAMISHSGLTVTLSALALYEAKLSLQMAKTAIVLSYEGYGANQSILQDEINRLRSAPGQAETAQWFRSALEGAENKPRRIQEALSFRTVASVIGAASHALEHAITVWSDEANGAPDSPAVLENGEMISTINFNTTALALAMESVTLALAGVANGCVQRMQRITNPELSGLPKFLSPIGGKSAGLIPAQKTAAALLTDIRHEATPIMFDPAPISVGVEDMAPNTPAVARKLLRQIKPLQALIGLESLVACQAIDLRNPSSLSALSQKTHNAVRKEVMFMQEDRAIGAEINKVADVLMSLAKENAGN